MRAASAAPPTPPPSRMHARTQTRSHRHKAEDSGYFHERLVSLLSQSRTRAEGFGAWAGCSPRAPAGPESGSPSLLEPLDRGQHSCIPSAGPATIGPRCISSACLCACSCPPANGAWPSVQIPALTHPPARESPRSSLILPQHSQPERLDGGVSAPGIQHGLPPSSPT